MVKAQTVYIEHWWGKLWVIGQLLIMAVMPTHLRARSYFDTSV